MTVSNQIVEVINTLCDKFGIAIDWGQKNILPYIQDLMSRYINYEIVTSAMWLIISIIAIISGILIVKKIHKRNVAGVFDDADDFLECISIILMIIGVIVFFVQAYDIIECATIPELQLCEYLKRLQ